MEMNLMKLSDLKISESLKVSFINAEPTIKHRLNDLGITKGVVITLSGISPLGDPYHIELRGYRLAIEKALLAYIEGDKV